MARPHDWITSDRIRRRFVRALRSVSVRVSTDSRYQRLFHTPTCAVLGACNRSKHGGLPALAAKHTELNWAAGAVAAADHTRSGAEQRARTTAVAILAAAQNGTYACARQRQACLAWGGWDHAVNCQGHPLVASQMLGLLLEDAPHPMDHWHIPSRAGSGPAGHASRVGRGTAGSPGDGPRLGDHQAGSNAP